MASRSVQALAGRGMPSRVRADFFNPEGYGSGAYYDPEERLRQLEEGFRMNPGRAPNGSGTTGLLSGDKQGWSNVLREQQEYLKLRDLAEGGGGDINVRLDPRSNFRSSFEPLDHNRAPDRDFFSAGASRPRSVALDVLNRRRF